MLNPEKTTQSILKKFEIGEFEKRKIVFWYDKDGTADEEGLAQIGEALGERGIKLHVLNNNFFATKKLLEKDDTESSYLIYSGEAERDPELNWLLDIQLYSGRFENSRISDIKSEFGIEGYDLDRFLEKHQQFFASKKRVVPLKRMYQGNWRDEEFTLGFLGVLSGSSTTDLKEIIRKILINSLDEGSNTVWEEIVRFELVEEFWDMVNRYFGYRSEEPTLRKLFLSFTITHISRNTNIDLKKYKAYSNSLSNECEIFIRGWMDNSKDSGIFDDYCKLILDDNNGQLKKYLNTEIKKYDIADYIEAESLALFDKHIIRKIVDELDNGKEDFESYLEWVASRKTKHWYSEFENIYNALEYAVRLHHFAKEFNEENLSDQNLNRFFRNYTERYYLMDYYYRKFYYHYDKDSQKDDLKTTREDIEKLYNNRLLDRLLTKWSELISQEMNGRWNIELIDRQDEFYKLYIKNIINRNDKDKIAVVISDAMRYEVAAELQDVLNKDTRGTVELKYMTGSLPSYTKLGMASLLPHERLEYRNQFVLADGMSTEAENRGKILEKMTSDSIAMNYKELMDLKQSEVREKFKGIRLFYIYHDKIDAIGDHSVSESGVFDAVEDTIEDIKKVIEKLTNAQIINNLLVTADHGFIYQREALESYDKVETGNFDKEKIIASSKRFILSEEDIDLMNVHKFNMDYMIESEKQKETFAYVPQADLRFKMQGPNKNFVHGGAAPQEIVVPVLKYTYNRTTDLDRKGIKHGKVGLAVINASRKITSSPFSINILQTEKVTEKLLSRRFKVALWDMDGDEFKVSDEKLVIAESASDEASDRQYKVTLTLTGEVENKVYYIRLIDEDPTEINKDIIDPMPFEVDLLIVDDF